MGGACSPELGVVWEEPYEIWVEKRAGQTLDGGLATQARGGFAESPTRELLESPTTASHFTGEGAGTGRELIKSE